MSDGSVQLQGGTANALFTPPTTLPAGVYLVSFYNCLTSSSQDYYVEMTAQAASGSISAGFTNRNFSQLTSFNQVPFVVKVVSATASVQFLVVNNGNGAATITNNAASCSSFYYTQISP